MPHTIQCRPEVNALTVPQSYKLRFVPRSLINTDELAAQIEAEHPVYNQNLAKAMIEVIMRKIQQNLIQGNQVVLDDFLSFSLGFSAKLKEPDSQLPDIKDILHVQIRALAPLVREIHHQGQIERLAMTERAPVIGAVEDAGLRLKDVVRSGSIVQLTGTNLFFENAPRGWECALECTRGGRIAQTHLGPVSATKLVFAPDLPEPEAPWNNEYTISVATRFTVNGTLRTGTYRRKLRSPLFWDGLSHEGGTGILTGSAQTPHVAIVSGTVAADEMLRIQAVFEPRDSELRLSLLDMREDGKTGVAVTVTGNGNYTLNGFAGSAVSSLALTVHSYDELVELVRHGYSGRLVDILDIHLA